MPRFRRPVRFLIAALLGFMTCSSVLAYSQSDGRPAHQWITQQGWRLLQSQFGTSEIDGFLGEVKEYNQAAEQQLANKTRVIQGVYDEDQGGQNPFGSSEPTLRHFWDKYAADYHRDLMMDIPISMQRRTEPSSISPAATVSRASTKAPRAGSAS